MSRPTSRIATSASAAASFCALVATLCCWNATAQDAAPPAPAATEPAPAQDPLPIGTAPEPDAPPATDPITTTEAEAPSPPPIAAPPAPARPLTPEELILQIDPVLYEQYIRRMRQQAREITRLERVMRVEGNEFSEEKYQSYRDQKVAGIVLVVTCGIGLISTIAYGAYVTNKDEAEDQKKYDAYSNSQGEYYGEDTSPLGTPEQRATLWTMLVVGVAGAAIGVPLLVHSRRGRSRQEVLRRKDEIMAPTKPNLAALRPFVDPERGLGGLQLMVTF